MAQISYGSITIVDITDVGQFSVYPRADASKTQIYNPDQNSYTPNWDTSAGGTKVSISPAAFYAGKAVSSGVTYTWQRRNGGGAASTLITGESVVNGTLEITRNVLANATGGLLTYVCTAHYTVDGITLQAVGEIDFSLISQGSAAKVAKIVGDNIFKINSSGNYVNSSIVLNATVNNTSISAWKYYAPTNDNADSDGYVVYPNSGTATYLTVNTSDTPVVAARNGNGSIRIKLLTTDSDTYDIFTITILKDGTDAQSSVAAILTNQVQMLPADDDGTLIEGALNGATTQLTIYEQGVDRTSTWTINKVPSTGIQLVSNQANNVATVSSINQNVLTGKVRFDCSKTGFPNFSKEFSLVKVMSGTDGRSPIVYSLEADSVVVNKRYTYSGNSNTNPTVSVEPTTVTFKAYKWEENTKSDYNGRIQFYINGSSSISNLSEQDINTRSYNFASNTSTTSLKAVLYKAGANTEELDSQTVIVVSDGIKGAQGPEGPQGINAVSLAIQNEADVIPCDSDGHPLQAFTIDIPFEGYQGTTKMSVVATAPTLSKDVWGTNTNIAPGGSSSNGSNVGHVTYTIPTTATVPEKGTISISFSITTADSGSVVVSKIYSWTRSKAATNGQNAVILTVTTPEGTVFVNGDNILSIKGTLYDGASEATSVTYKYYKYTLQNNTATYVEITSTSSTDSEYIAVENGKRILKVKGTAIDGFGSYKIGVQYNNQNYEDYVSLIDKTDPLQVSVHSTVGTQIKNAQGVGCLYVRVTRNGVVIDPVPDNIIVSETEPSNPVDGTAYVKITKPTGTGSFSNIPAYTGSAQLMKYNGSQWAAQTSECTYSWTYRDSNNNPLDKNSDKKPATEGQFVYIDASLIQNKITADVTVTLNRNSS